MQDEQDVEEPPAVLASGTERIKAKRNPKEP
jgi:ataxia telangiectasia mutated family protein